MTEKTKKMTEKTKKMTEADASVCLILATALCIDKGSFTWLCDESEAHQVILSFLSPQAALMEN